MVRRCSSRHERGTAASSFLQDILGSDWASRCGSSLRRRRFLRGLFGSQRDRRPRDLLLSFPPMPVACDSIPRAVGLGEGRFGWCWFGWSVVVILGFSGIVSSIPWAVADSLYVEVDYLGGVLRQLVQVEGAAQVWWNLMGFVRHSSFGKAKIMPLDLSNQGQGGTWAWYLEASGVVFGDMMYRLVWICWWKWRKKRGGKLNLIHVVVSPRDVSTRWKKRRGAKCARLPKDAEDSPIKSRIKKRSAEDMEVIPIEEDKGFNPFLNQG